METILTTEGKVRLFVQLEDFHGWDLHAAWDDFKFGLSIIPTSSGSQWSATANGKSGWRAFCKPFTKAKVKYFDRSEVDAAWKWLQENRRAEPRKKRIGRRMSPRTPNDGAPSFGIGFEGSLAAEHRTGK